MRLLIVEDNQQTARHLSTQLKANFIIDLASTGESGEYLATVNDYQLLIVDLGLPDMNGLNLVKNLRKQQLKEPILILSGYQQPNQIAQGLRAGADDYLTKPFVWVELQARIDSLLRRKSSFLGNCTQAGPFKFNFSTKELSYRQKPIKLSAKETMIIECLFRNQGRIITKPVLTASAWKKDYLLSNSLQVHINRLRNKIDRRFDYQLIHTVHGRGYTIRSN